MHVHVKIRRMFGIGVLACAAPAFADLAYSNFGPGDDFQLGVGQTISGAGSSVGLSRQANGFTSLASGPVSEIRVAMGLVEGANEFTLTLFEDSGGALGAALGSWTVTGEMDTFGDPYPAIAVATPGAASLTLGDGYWLLAEAANTTWAAWNREPTNAITTVAIDGGAGFEYVDGIAGAFEVSVVPEPATLGLLIVAAGLIRRR